MQQLLLLFAARFVTAGIVAVLISMIASLYYVDLKGVDLPSEVMKDRPNAPGSAAAALAEHPHCGESGGPVIGAIVRRTPNSPYIYVSSVEHKRGRLFIRAVEQGVQGKDRGLDTVLAFCTDRSIQRGTTP